jgi:hypothetical protein
MLVAALIVAASMSSLPDEIFFSEMEFGACPAGQITRSAVTYAGDRVNNVDVTQFENIWGRVSASNAPVPWPGAPGSTPSIDMFARSGYIAASFVTLHDMASYIGMYVNVSYPPGPVIDASISQQCGDFAAGLGTCIVYQVPAQDQPMLHWRGANGPTLYCLLQPDTTYYVNMRLSNPDDGSTYCGPDTCIVTTSSTFAQ